MFTRRHGLLLQALEVRKAQAAATGAWCQQLPWHEADPTCLCQPGGARGFGWMGAINNQGEKLRVQTKGGPLW